MREEDGTICDIWSRKYGNICYKPLGANAISCILDNNGEKHETCDMLPPK